MNTTDIHISYISLVERGITVDTVLYTTQAIEGVLDDENIPAVVTCNAHTIKVQVANICLAMCIEAIKDYLV